MVREEVRLFDPKMVLRPVVVAANKIDLPQTEEKLRALRRHLGGKVEGVYPVSANTGQGIAALLEKVAEVVDQEETKGRAKASGEGPSQSLQAEARRATGVTVEKAPDGRFDVHAPSVERLVGGTDLRQWRARVQLWEALRRRGVVRALERAGAGPGAKVRFGDKELEWS
jgi:GTP-binding protein